MNTRINNGLCCVLCANTVNFDGKVYRCSACGMESEEPIYCVDYETMRKHIESPIENVTEIDMMLTEQGK